MKKIEKNVFKKIYLFETKKTISTIFVNIFLMAMGIVVLWVFTIMTLEIFTEQETFGLLMSFKEDFNEAITHLDGIMASFYQEAPKLLLLLIVCLVFCIGLLIIKLIKERNKLKNKIRLLIHFWFRSKKIK